MNGAPLASLPRSTREDVAVAVDAARAAQRAWSRTPMEVRERIMLRYHDLVLDRQVELLDVVQLESGKTRGQAFEEVADVALVARHYGRSAAAYLRPRRRAGLFPVLTQSTEHHHPRGVVGIVSPWNYPLSLAHHRRDPGDHGRQRRRAASRPPGLAHGAAGRAAARPRPGCRSRCSRSCSVTVPTVGQAVVDLADYVCFTGSTATGRSVAASVGGRLARVLPRARRQEPDVRRRRRRPRQGRRGRRPGVLLLGRSALHVGRAADRARQRGRRVHRRASSRRSAR